MAVVPIELPPCEQFPEIPEFMDVVLPGGLTIRQILNTIADAPSQFTGSIDLFRSLEPALTPLIPLFDVIDTIFNVVNCLKSLAGPPINPGALLECLPDIFEKVEVLQRYLPFYSVPILLRAILDAFIHMLRGVISHLLVLQSQLVSIGHCFDRAAELNDSNLEAIASCAQRNVDTQRRSTAEMLRSLGHLIALINLFFSLIGATERIGDLSLVIDPNSPIPDLIGVIEDIIDEMQWARDQIVVPEEAL